MTEDEIKELQHKRILKNETVHKIVDTVLDKIPLAQGTVPNFVIPIHISFFLFGHDSCRMI